MKYQDKVLSFAESTKPVEFPERTAKKMFGEWVTLIRVFPTKEAMWAFLDKQNSKPVSMQNAFVPCNPRLRRIYGNNLLHKRIHERRIKRYSDK